MKLAGLFSGGKDSTFSVFLASKSNEIKCVITIISKNPESYMFHTSNIELTKLQAKLMDIPIISVKTLGIKEEELKDLRKAIKNAKEKYKIQGIVCGAVGSNYQKKRIQKICSELDLKLVSPLWKINKENYLNSLIKEFDVIITSVNAEGFNKSWLGRKIDKRCIEDLKELNKKYGVDLVGEGGEFETLVLNCPLFKKKIKIIKSEKIWEENSGFLRVIKATI